MVGTLRIKVEGLKQVERNLLALAADLGPRKARSTLRIPMRDAMAPVLQDITANTSIDTGGLRRSIKGVGRSPSKATLKRSKNTIYTYSTGYFWRRGATRSQFKKAVALEYGTRSQPQLATLRNALCRNQRKVLSGLADRLGRSIEKRAIRLRNTGR